METQDKKGQGMVAVTGLTKQFKKVLAVDGVSFEAKAGEIFGLLGPNGAGKTTTLRMLATTLKPTGGTAVIAGHDVVSHPEEVRRKIGVLTASIGLYGRLTARENVAYFGRLHGMTDLQIKVGLDEIIEVLEMKDFADRRAENFSTGMKQKVAIARAIIHDPPVLMLDEPTSGLDVLGSQTVEKFMALARVRGKCVLFSTHLMWTAEKLCDRAAIVHQGKIVAVDTVAELMKRTDAGDLEEAFVRLIGAGAK
jgi:sodium transport system ATP-binding protein